MLRATQHRLFTSWQCRTDIGNSIKTIEWATRKGVDQNLHIADVERTPLVRPASTAAVAASASAETQFIWVMMAHKVPLTTPHRDQP